MITTQITTSEILDDIQVRIDSLTYEISSLPQNRKNTAKKQELKARLSVQKEAYNFNYWLAYIR